MSLVREASPTIRAAILRLHKETRWAVSSLALFVAGVLIFGEFVAPADEASHAIEHLRKGAPIVLLALAVYGLWRPRSPIMRVARALFVLGTLVLGVGQLEHSIGAFAGHPLHIVAKVSPSQIAVIGLGILLAIASGIRQVVHVRT